MSFKYKRQNITLENYRSIFSECTPDILDEIRSAILDDTQIGGFIAKCGTDNYKLGQIRMALRELVPLECINVGMTGKTIYMIRKCVDSGINIDSLMQYYDKTGLTVSPLVLETLSEFVYLGTDISKVDFSYVPIKFVNLICKGLTNGFPMWLIIDPEVEMTEEKIKALMRGMQLGIDVHPFIYDDWSNEQLYLIFSYSNNLNINDFLGFVNSNFDSASLKVLLDLYAKKLPIAKLCVRDSDNTPVYNHYQMYEIGSALEDSTITDDMYNPKLSDIEISELHNSKLFD